jgi:sortase B
MDFEPWMEEIRQNQLYDTEIDAVFGDEFITLTTCNRARHRNGRFVVVCRKIREGEIFE